MYLINVNENVLSDLFVVSNEELHNFPHKYYDVSLNQQPYMKTFRPETRDACYNSRFIIYLPNSYNDLIQYPAITC